MDEVRNPDQLRNMMAQRPQAESKEERMAFQHAAVASQAIKVVNSIRMDPFVKKVMTLRIMGPMITGKERSHMSIALELGAPVDDVIAAEAYGVQVVNTLLQRVDMPDFIEKYNRDSIVDREVRKLGNSSKN